jgi:cytochrome b6-f complex iron-sulfur subunit
MTTITNGKGRSAGLGAAGLSRREFLFYLGGASAAVFAAGTCGAAYWFTQQRISYGRNSGMFLLEVAELPTTTLAPLYYADGFFYLVLGENGLLALDGHCVRDYFLIRWVENNHRFECPGCGSKYQLDGTWIEGPANRSADRYVLEVRTPDETPVTPADGTPVSVADVQSVVVDTRRRILGTFHATPTPYGRRRY